MVLQPERRVAFDGVSAIGREAFLAMLSRVMPQPSAPWDALWWDARIHLAIFVHRVDGVAPGLYLLARDPAAIDRLRAACGREFLWERAADSALPLYRLARGDCRAVARRLSCDQDIAADGFFSLGMIAEFDASLETFGAVVLPPAVLGVGRGGAGAVSRSGSGRRARHRHRLLLRRSRPRSPRDQPATASRACITSRSASRSMTPG